ncbi:response regulator [Paenibacillus sp. FSL H8-0034]|uniref:response regulator n=1 Tax=Paenibacillus sp. FSL H8-0034 TaxID=2954671 RepID=UPI0030F62801
MLKVLIVEDEMIVRVGIKSMIPWTELGCELIGEAANGSQALDMVHSHQPDVVLTDIQMPVMNGIELMKQLKEQYPHIQVIILSCHNDFEYVQQALKLGAVDYILKLSMQPQELQNLLIRVRDIKKKLKEEERSEAQKIQKIHISSQVMKHKAIIEMLEGKPQSQEQWAASVKDWTIPLHDSIGLIAIRIDDLEKKQQAGTLKNKELTGFSVSNIALEILRMELSGDVVINEQGIVILLANCGNPEVWEHHAQAVAERIQVVVHQYLKLSVSIGISGKLGDPSIIPENYRTAIRTLEYTFYYPKSTIIGSDVLATVRDQPIYLTEEEVRHIEDELLLENKEQLQLIIHDVLHRFLNPTVEVRRARAFFDDLLLPFYRHLKRLELSSIELPEFNGYYPNEAVRKIETLAELIQWFLDWIGFYIDFYKVHANTRMRSEIWAARAYMNRHYQQKIAIADIASSIGLSEAYLSHLYKKETGENLVDYLTKYRLEQAKELLRNSDLRTYEIAERIGFADANYFSKQFKRYEGRNPLDYRNQFLKK